MNAYCRSLTGFDATVAIRDSSSPYGWRCYLAGPLDPISITACRFQYTDLVARGFGVFEDPGNNVTDRKCQVNATTVIGRGGMNLSGYCQSIGLSSAANRLGNVDGWLCYNSSGSPVARIDLNRACQWQNTRDVQLGYVVVAVYPNFTAAFRIGCVAIV